jgi:hypothetical protein
VITISGLPYVRSPARESGKARESEDMTMQALLLRATRATTTARPDEALWFTNPATNTIKRITTSLTPEIGKVHRAPLRPEPWSPSSGATWSTRAR